MNNTINGWFFLGATVVGLVSAAGVYLIEQFRQDKRRHAYQRDLIRLDGQLSSIRADIETLRRLQQRDKANTSSSHKSSRRKLRNSSAVSVTSTEDYNSALDIDSSDLEFYDLSSEEDASSEEVNVKKELELCDRLYEDETEYEVLLNKLENLNKRYPNNANVLWRLGRTLRTKIETITNSEKRKELVNRGIEICEHACDLEPLNANCHKWFAILVGLRSDFQPIKERILDGNLYLEHIIKALELAPMDPTLHHLLGRYKFEVASLPWVQKSVASRLFAQLPEFSYADALENFLDAEKLNEKDWKENRLYIAKCEIGVGKMDSAVEWLSKADSVINKEEEKVTEEVKSLLKKYKK